MHSTRNIILNNGKKDDYRETLYIRLMKSTYIYSYHIAWETNGDGFCKAGTGDIKDIKRKVESGWWVDFLMSEIIEMIRDQTCIENVDDYVHHEGAWMVASLEERMFDDDMWNYHMN